MPGITSATQLIRELARDMELPQLALDESGCCCLLFDGRISVDLEYDDAAQAFRISSHLPLPRQEMRPFLYEQCLKANYFYRELGKAYFGLDPDTGEIVMIREAALSGMDYPIFLTVLEQFVQTAQEWTGVVQGAHVPAQYEAKPKGKDLRAIDWTMKA
jgi:hypothetical protein